MCTKVNSAGYVSEWNTFKIHRLMLTACRLHNICMLHTNISLCVKSSEFLQLTEAKDFRKSCLSSLKHFYMISQSRYICCHQQKWSMKTMQMSSLVVISLVCILNYLEQKSSEADFLIRACLAFCFVFYFFHPCCVNRAKQTNKRKTSGSLFHFIFEIPATQWFKQSGWIHTSQNECAKSRSWDSKHF